MEFPKFVHLLPGLNKRYSPLFHGTAAENLKKSLVATEV